METLKIKSDVGDTVEIYLDPNKHPVAYTRKKQELVKSGMSEREAEKFLFTTPFVLEIFYDMDRGLFGVESEFVACNDVFNPYTGKLIPYESTGEEQEKDTAKEIDEITCNLSNTLDQLQEINLSCALSSEGEEVMEEAISHLEDCLTEIHKFTDPDDKRDLFNED